MSASVRFITLGCRVNQYETQAMRESLAGIGIQELMHETVKLEKQRIDSKIDFVVINTCTVTNVADRENFYWIRRAKREHPAAKIVVTGCFVEKNRQELEKLPDVDLVITNREKSRIANFLTDGCGTPAAQSRLSVKEPSYEFSPLFISHSHDRSRAYLKIQDGCNHACSFCKVVLVRGRSRSRLLDGIVDEARRLRDAGHQEVVLTGIQLGAYGLDLTPRIGLVDVIEECSKIEGVERIRLSSIEPTDVKPELIALLRHNKKCCPHLHIPLQSGDDEILKRMNRRYSRAYYLDLVNRLKSEVCDFSLTLDVMAGFPGEDERHFENTTKLLEELKPLKCHVFPYSRREGTKASRFSDDVVAALIRRRVEYLISLSDRLGQAAAFPFVGRTMSVLAEKNKARGRGMLMQGVTGNFLKVCFQGNKSQLGRLVSVRLLALQGPLFLGQAVAL